MHLCCIVIYSRHPAHPPPAVLRPGVKPGHEPLSDAAGPKNERKVDGLLGVLSVHQKNISPELGELTMRG
jgi:hypothetical protein